MSYYYLELASVRVHREIGRNNKSLEHNVVLQTSYV